MDYQDLFGTGFANRTRKELEKDRDHEQYVLDQLLARYLSTPEGQAQGRIGVTHVNPVDPESDFGKLIIGGKIKLKTWSDLDPLFRIKVRQAEYLRNERYEFILIKRAENLANMSAMKRLADERRAKGKAARELFFATYIPKDKPQSSEPEGTMKEREGQNAMNDKKEETKAKEEEVGQVLEGITKEEVSREKKRGAAEISQPSTQDTAHDQHASATKTKKTKSEPSPGSQLPTLSHLAPQPPFLGGTSVRGGARSAPRNQPPELEPGEVPEERTLLQPKGTSTASAQPAHAPSLSSAASASASASTTSTVSSAPAAAKSATTSGHQSSTAVPIAAAHVPSVLPVASITPTITSGAATATQLPVQAASTRSPSQAPSTPAPTSPQPQASPPPVPPTAHGTKAATEHEEGEEGEEIVFFPDLMAAILR